MAKLPVFGFHRESDCLLVFKDHNLELKIKTDQPMALEKYLRNLLPSDYMEWIETYNLEPDIHTAGWLLNLCCMDRSVADMFRKVIVKPVWKNSESQS